MKHNTNLMYEAKSKLRGHWGPLVLISIIIISVQHFPSLIGTRFNIDHSPSAMDNMDWDDDDVSDIKSAVKAEILDNLAGEISDMNDESWSKGKDKMSGRGNKSWSRGKDKTSDNTMGILCIDNECLFGKNDSNRWHFIVFLVIVFLFILHPLLNVGQAKIYLQFEKESNLNLKNLLFGFYHNFGTTIKAWIRAGIVWVLWSFLLIIPGIIYLFAISLSPFILAEKTKLNSKEVLVLSRRMMEGHKLKLLGLLLRFLGWFILGVLGFMVPFLWILPYFTLTFTKFYEEVKADKIDIFENFSLTR